jgi:hypothetical protein
LLGWVEKLGVLYTGMSPPDAKKDVYNCTNEEPRDIPEINLKDDHPDYNP